MAPPLFDGPRLIPCPNCRVHIKRSDTSCLHCGAALDARGSTFAPMIVPIALGLLLSGCGDDGGVATGGDDVGNDTSAGSTSVMTTQSVTDSTVGNDDAEDSFGEEAAYGVGVTTDDIDTGEGTTSSGGTGGTSGSGSDTAGSDSGTTGGTGMTTGTDTGASTGDSTSSGGDEVGEPEYGVPSTGIEPLYGVGISDDGLSG